MIVKINMYRKTKHLLFIETCSDYSSRFLNVQVMRTIPIPAPKSLRLKKAEICHKPES